MAKLPNNTRIPTSSVLGSVISTINRFIGLVSLALNKQLTIVDNMDGDVIKVTVSGIYPLEIPWTRPNPPTMAWIGQCRETDNIHTIFTSPLYLDWEYNSDHNTLQINSVVNLSDSASNTYTLTIIAITT